MNHVEKKSKELVVQYLYDKFFTPHGLSNDGVYRALDDLVEEYNITKTGISIEPIPLILHCPECHDRHIDVGEFATKPHHTHACQNCGMVWRPAIVNTVGVSFLPGYKND